MKKVTILLFTVMLIASLLNCEADDDGGGANSDGSGAGSCILSANYICGAFPYVPDYQYSVNYCSGIGGSWSSSPSCSSTDRVARCIAENDDGYAYTTHYYPPWDLSSAADDCDTIFGLFTVGK
ncbi:hypothetical protein ACFL20_10045 [Spirochaetota bacterium]